MDKCMYTNAISCTHSLREVYLVFATIKASKWVLTISILRVLCIFKINFKVGFASLLYKAFMKVYLLTQSWKRRPYGWPFYIRL